jgi:hypothetical protein
MFRFSKSADIPDTPTTLRRFRRLAMGIATILVFYVPLHAQYGGGGTMGTGGTSGTGGTTGTGSSTPSYGHGKAIGIGVGAGAAGAAGLYVLMHRGSSVTGCVQPANDGLRLVDDKSKRSFSVMPGGAALVPGQHVHLRGKIIKQQDGAEIFEAKKLLKNLGTCGAQSADTQGGQ